MKKNNTQTPWEIKELERLENISNDSWYSKGMNTCTIEYSFNIFLRYLKKGSILELGPAEGVMTHKLSKKFDDITVVEGSSYFAESIKSNYPNIEVINSLFEDFKPSRKYDNLILGHVLEHVEQPTYILKLCREWISDGGVIVAAVPNANSIHRQAAVLMGLLSDTKQLNETDIHHGHRRVYDRDTFREDFTSAGFKINVLGGYWLKPLSNKQLEESWTEEMINAFMTLGEKYPEIAAEIYIVASKS